ncbi:MAG TPA: serine/threonine-protein kinase [Gemmatimonadales bacterium]|nr:serine/threonine-protein kinase [Gemmatimonadales bacterium]
MDPNADSLGPLQDLLAGQYVLERELGRGGMGVVYLARDVRLERPVAIKVLPRAHGADPELRERFLREARTSAQLAHPNIVPIYRADEVGGVAFFTMGFVDGENLAERLRTRGSLSPAEAVRVLRDAAWALAYAHARGVVHRDVKPANIMIERGTGRAVVTDFGIARNQLASSLTRAGTVLGSVHYMSPEQAAGDALDGRSDLYSLGVVGFQLLSGRLPFDAVEAAAVMAQQVTRQAPSLASVAPGVPPALVAVIDRSLRKAPADRYPTGEAFAEALESALQATPAEGEGSASEVVSTDQARAIWLRAAQLQAEATTRLQARYREPAADLAPAGSGASGGYRLEDVEQAASEAGIGPEFVAMAIAERPAGAAPAGSPALSAREDRVLSRMLGTRERSLSCARVIPAPPKAVLESIGRVCPGDPFVLRLRTTVGGHPLDGGILVFDVPKQHSAAFVMTPTILFCHRMAQLGVEQLNMALKPTGYPAGGCEVTVSADLRPGLRKAWLIDRWVSGVAGLGGAGAGAAVALVGVSPLGAAAVSAVALAGAGVFSGVSFALVRWGYRYALRKGREQLEGILAALEGDLHAISVFGSTPPGGGSPPRQLPDGA